MTSVIKIQPMTSAADCAAYTELFHQAFREGLMGAMYPISKQGFTTDARVEMCNALINDIRIGDALSRTRLIKAVDPTLEASGCDPINGVVGVAKWVFYPSRPAETIDREIDEIANARIPIDADEDFVKSWRRVVETAKGKTMGVGAWVYLSVLITRQGFQRKGIGKQMMAWGLRQAEQMQLPVYLEASRAGQPLYEKNGFVAHGRLPFDATPWTDTDMLEHVLMVRPAPEAVYLNGNGRSQE